MYLTTLPSWDKPDIVLDIQNPSFVCICDEGARPCAERGPGSPEARAFHAAEASPGRWGAGRRLKVRQHARGGEEPCPKVTRPCHSSCVVKVLVRESCQTQSLAPRVNGKSATILARSIHFLPQSLIISRIGSAPTETTSRIALFVRFLALNPTHHSKTPGDMAVREIVCSRRLTFKHIQLKSLSKTFLAPLHHVPTGPDAVYHR